MLGNTARGLISHPGCPEGRPPPPPSRSVDQGALQGPRRAKSNRESAPALPMLTPTRRQARRTSARLAAQKSPRANRQDRPSPWQCMRHVSADVGYGNVEVYQPATQRVARVTPSLVAKADIVGAAGLHKRRQAAPSATANRPAASIRRGVWSFPRQGGLNRVMTCPAEISTGKADQPFSVLGQEAQHDAATDDEGDPSVATRARCAFFRSAGVRFRRMLRSLIAWRGRVLHVQATYDEL